MSHDVRYRILPLEREVFKGYRPETIHAEFFEEDMVGSADEYGCAYLAFQRQDLGPEDGLAFVLFQFGTRVVACGMLVDVDLFEEADEEGFTGQYVFNASSIVTFAPLGLDGLRKAFPRLQPLGGKVQVLDPAGFDAFVELVRPTLLNIEPEDFLPQAWIAGQQEAMGRA